MRYEEIENWFSYHPPTQEQLQAYEVLREGGKELAHLINKYVPDCADKTAAIRKLRETIMTANAAIACYVPLVQNI